MRTRVGTFTQMDETLNRMENGGLLLVGGKRGNPMTIGWGTVGIIWGLPVFLVLVRPSRFTFSLMEGHDEFSVNVPTEDLKTEVAFCGSRSGRDTNKIKECGFKLIKSADISVPCIKECAIHYECKTIHRNNVINADLDPNIVAGSYPAGNFHKIYYGHILGVYRMQGD